MARNDLEPHYGEDGWKVVFRLFSDRVTYRGNRIGSWFGFFCKHPRLAWNQVKSRTRERINHQKSRRWLIWTGVVIGAAIWLFWLLPAVWPSAIPLEENPTPDAHRMAAIALRLGVLAFIAVASIPLVIWRTMIAQRNAETGEQGLITERFTRAVDQIGAVHGNNAPNIEVRLGGLYALERIAQDSDRDHWQVMEVLTAYIRQNCGIPIERPNYGAEEEQEEWFFALKPPREDVQTALTIIGRRSADRRSIERRENYQVNLAGTNLRKIDFGEAHLEEAEFREAHLEGADFFLAHLKEAHFMKARLEKTNFGDADFTCAVLIGANLESAEMFGALLMWSDLSGAHLKKANLMKANMEYVDLTDANLESTDLSGANLSFASVHDAEFTLTIVWETNFTSIHGLTQEQVDSMWEGDGATTIPEDIERPAHWPEHELSIEERAERRKLWRDGKPPPGKAGEGEG